MKKSIWLICIPLMLAGCDFEDRVPIEMVSMSRTQTLVKEKILESTISFDIGSLEITGEPTAVSLYSFYLEYDKASYAPDIQYNTVPDGSEG